MRITTIDQLAALYGEPGDASLVKVTPGLTAEYRRLVEASPFVTVATAGPEGLDCSPRGDRPGRLVRIVDDRTLMLPDRRGNNRIDTLRNIVRDGRIALLFLIPGSGTTLRINGRAEVHVSPDLLASFAVEEKAPRSVVVITIDEVYFQCARAIVRSALWSAGTRIDPADLPTPGEILASTSGARVGGAAYDDEWPQRAAKTMW